MTIHLFTVHGATFTFRNATIESDTESMLVIRYVSATDSTVKRLTVVKANLVGYAVTTEEKR